MPLKDTFAAIGVEVSALEDTVTVAVNYVVDDRPAAAKAKPIDDLAEGLQLLVVDLQAVAANAAAAEGAATAHNIAETSHLLAATNESVLHATATYHQRVWTRDVVDSLLRLARRQAPAGLKTWTELVFQTLEDVRAQLLSLQQAVHAGRLELDEIAIAGEEHQDQHVPPNHEPAGFEITILRTGGLTEVRQILGPVSTEKLSEAKAISDLVDDMEFFNLQEYIPSGGGVDIDFYRTIIVDDGNTNGYRAYEVKWDDRSEEPYHGQLSALIDLLEKSGAHFVDQLPGERVDWDDVSVIPVFVDGFIVTMGGEAAAPTAVDLEPEATSDDIDYVPVYVVGRPASVHDENSYRWMIFTPLERLPHGRKGTVLVGATKSEYISWWDLDGIVYTVRENLKTLTDDVDKALDLAKKGRYGDIAIEIGKTMDAVKRQEVYVEKSVTIPDFDPDAFRIHLRAFFAASSSGLRGTREFAENDLNRVHHVHEHERVATLIQAIDHASVTAWDGVKALDSFGEGGAS